MSTNYHTPLSGSAAGLADFNTRLSDLDAAIRAGGVHTATVDPTASDDSASGYLIGSGWINTAGKRIWQCVSNAAGAAVWQLNGGVLKAKIGLTANIPVATNFQYDIPWDRFDSGQTGWWSSTTNPERITPNRAGIYDGYAFFRWGFDNNGLRLPQIFKNGSQVGASRRVAAGNSEDIVYVPDISLNGTTDYITLRAFQSSGSPIDAVNNAYLLVKFMGV